LSGGGENRKSTQKKPSKVLNSRENRFKKEGKRGDQDGEKEEEGRRASEAASPLKCWKVREIKKEKTY